MVDSNDGVSGGVPRSPTFDWKDKIADARVSYHGEVVLKAEALELDRVLASLPPEGFGGIVNILDVCDQRLSYQRLTSLPSSLSRRSG